MKYLAEVRKAGGCLCLLACLFVCVPFRSAANRKKKNLAASHPAKTHQQSAAESIWFLFTSSGSPVTRQHGDQGGRGQRAGDWFINRREGDAPVIKQVIGVAPRCAVSKDGWWRRCVGAGGARGSALKRHDTTEWQTRRNRRRALSRRGSPLPAGAPRRAAFLLILWQICSKIAADCHLQLH